MGKNKLSYLYNEHKKQLKNMNISHKKFLICFSGVPGSGKTYLSKILEIKYKAVRINNDDIRDIIGFLKIRYPKLFNEDKQEILQEYLIWILQSYKGKNGLIILDGSIDRKYKLICDTAIREGFEIFTISLKFNEKNLLERAVKREKGEIKSYRENLPRWKKDYREFNKKGLSDVIINTENKKDMEMLFILLDSRIQ